MPSLRGGAGVPLARACTPRGRTGGCLRHAPSFEPAGVGAAGLFDRSRRLRSAAARGTSVTPPLDCPCTGFRRGRGSARVRPSSARALLGARARGRRREFVFCGTRAFRLGRAFAWGEPQPWAGRGTRWLQGVRLRQRPGRGRAGQLRLSSRRGPGRVGGSVGAAWSSARSQPERSFGRLNLRRALRAAWVRRGQPAFATPESTSFGSTKGLRGFTWGAAEIWG